MVKSYARGYDLPPLMRDSLLADERAAAGFNSLGAAAQQSAVEKCSGMSSKAQIDEFIRQTDCFMFDDICLSEPGGRNPDYL